MSEAGTGRVTGMPRRVEALKPQAEFEERLGGAGEGGRPRTRIVGRVLKQHCGGMEAEKRASDETLCRVLNGAAEDVQGEDEIRWAFETMGPDALAALHTEGRVRLERLAAAKRRSQSDPKQEDVANAWLNAALRKEQGLKLERQVQDIAAHARKAPLAILAGAGISKPAPSDVPLYHELAIELAGATPGQAAEDPGACFDRVHKERGEAVYEQAAERVRGQTKPNGLHRWMVALHSAAGSRTIITTNWDELIEAAGTARGKPLRVWPEHERGPGAGHRASGLVHLHGTVSKPGGMLLTKMDLERHYDQERECRFVGEIVGDRSMLCIGYSHRDVMIRKIQESVAARERAREGEDGRGRRKTFSLVKRESGKPGWEDDLQRLEAAGIEPVLYDRHEEVPEILDRVARAIAQDAEEERRRLEAMAKQGPRPDTDWNEVGRVLEEGGPRLEHFLRKAALEAWAVPEFMQAGAARVLREETEDPSSGQLSGWLCDGMDGERLRTILWMAAKAGGLVGPALRSRLAWRLGDSDTAVGDMEREQGALFLIGQYENTTHGMREYLPLRWVAQRCSEAGLHEASIQGWAAVANVYAAAGSRLGSVADGVEETGTLEPRLNVEGWEAKEFYAKAVKPWMEQIHEAVWAVCAHALERQQCILETACGEEEPWNGWSRQRSAIEEHEQDEQRYARGVDALIDAARDALECGGRPGRTGQEKWEARIRRAGASKNVLLNRLAIHGVTESRHWGADRKVRWLGESGLLGNPCCVHEAYRLLKEHWKRARGATRKAVGRRICRLRIRGKSREGNEEEQYVLLGWIQQWGTLTRDMKERQWVLQNRHMAWKMPAHPDFRNWSSGAQWIGAVAPPGWAGRQLLDGWKEQGRAALDGVIEEWENPASARTPEEFLHGPNESGRQEGAGDAIRLDRKWGIALARRLMEREKWDHEAWRALCRELPKRMEPMELIEWAREGWLREVGKGRCRGALSGIARGLAKRFQEGNGEVDVREAIETLEEWALGTLKRDERPQGEDWTNHCINTTAGAAIEGIIEQVSGETGGPEDRDAAFAALGRLWNASPAMRNHVATLCTNKLHALSLAPGGEEWVRAHIVKAVEEEAREELRTVVWGAMKYTRWSPRLAKMLKNAMERELTHEEAHGEADTCAERYARSMLRDILYPTEGGHGGRYESWKVAEFPSGRRATVVAELAYDLWTNEESRVRDAWGRILLPLWRDVCDHAEGGASEGEQGSFLHCFAFLNAGQQDEFRARFQQGPAVAPERFLDADYEPKEVENRMAALEVALHCAGGYAGHEAWKWTAALETIAGWAREPKSPEEERLAYNVLAKTGHTI